MVSPGRESTQPGLSSSDKRTRKPNSVLCGHSSRRRVAAGVHQRPTRRFRQQHWSSLTASSRCRARALLLARASLPIWSCSVWGLPCLRHYCRSGALLPHLFTLTIAWSSFLEQFRGMAVYFLWHLPSTSLKARVPDVIRHTALRSSDFPLPHFPALAEICGSDRPVLLPWDSLRCFRK